MRALACALLAAVAMIGMAHAADPEWLGSSIGISDELPAPWTPVAAAGGSLSCWGRDYDFADQALPARIVTAGEQVLAAPIRVRVTAGGTEQVWQPAQLRWTERSPTVASGHTSAKAARVQMQVDVALEFDGMMLLGLTVTPEPGTALDELILEIPIKPAHATYLHACDASWGRSVAEALPADGWAHDFMPFVWLGDEERGLQWFCESDEGWRPGDPQRALTIDREDDRVVLRANMLQRPLQPGQPFTTSFGLQATPVKPLPPEHREWHITHGASYGMQHRSGDMAVGISYPAPERIRLDRGSVDMWVKSLFDPQVGDTIGDTSVPNHSLFGVMLANGDHWGFYWNRDDRGTRFYARVNGKVEGYLAHDRLDTWRAGEWHHVAFTWGDQLRIYLDGELLASKDWQGTVPGVLEDARIWLGAGGAFRDTCRFAIDGLRISDAPLDFTDAALLDRNPPVAAESTLLLDLFEDERSDLPDGAALTEGVAGKALRLGRYDDDAGLLDYLKLRGVNTLVFHENWTEIQAYGSTKLHDQELRELVAACHAADIKLLLYFGYLLSDAAPEWAEYSDQVLTMPRRGGYRRKDFPQTAYISCPRSVWKEYVLTSIAHMIDEYDIDGVYLDGTTEPWACANEVHGCGYLAEDGTRHRTYPIAATRDLMRRMRQIIKSRKPDGLISAHMSASVTMPTLAFVDAYWDGEQLDVKERGFRLPLDAFRAEFMGHNYGVPAEFLSYENRPFTFEEALGLALLHDVPVRPTVLGRKLATVSKIWAAWDEFGIEAARWVPYWQTGGPLTTDDPDVLVSAHVGDKGVLAVVMNSSEEDREFTLSMAGEPGVARDVLKGDEIVFDGGATQMALPPLHMKLLLISHK